MRPDTSAYAAQIYQSDRGLSLALKPGHVVVLLGYLGEPVFRLDPAGLWVNAASPTAAVDGLLTKGQRITSATPCWRLRRGRHTAAWHDARVQRLAAGLDRGGWSVPLIVDGRRANLDGELRRFPAPSLWLWLGLLAGLLASGVSPLLLRRDDLVRAAAIGLGVLAGVASVVIALAFALDGYASPGTWIEGLDEIVFIAVGLGVLLRGPENLHVPAAIWLGLIALAVGLINGAVFLHPIVLAILPPTATRVAPSSRLAPGWTLQRSAAWSTSRRLVRVETASLTGDSPRPSRASRVGGLDRRDLEPEPSRGGSVRPSTRHRMLGFSRCTCSGRRRMLPSSMAIRLDRSTAVRSLGRAALVPAAAFAVHQLRYLLAFGGAAGVELQRQGHSYLHSVVPWIVLLFGVAAGGFLSRLGRAMVGQSSVPRFGFSLLGLWVTCSACLVAIYVSQEFLEGLFATGHPAGLAGILGFGGWWAIPASLCVGLVLAMLFHGARWAIEKVAARRSEPRLDLGDRFRQSPRSTHIPLPRLAPLALGWCGRGPPR